MKLFLEETNKEAVEKIMQLAKSKKIQIAMSDWSINEAIWAVEKKVQDSKMSKREARIIINSITDTVSDCIKEGVIVWLGFSQKAIIYSRTAIEEVRCNAADALHVYFAISSDCEYFISADENLILQMRFVGRLRIETVYLYSQNDMDRFFNVVENEPI